MTDPNNTALSHEQLILLSEQIENAIIKKYRKKFLGISSGVVVVISALTYFGLDNIKLSLKDSVSEQIATQDFKDTIVKNVTNEVVGSTQLVIKEIEENLSTSKLLLQDIKTNHMDVLRAASNEFSRTIDVLRIVRENIGGTNDHSNWQDKKRNK